MEGRSPKTTLTILELPESPGSVDFSKPITDGPLDHGFKELLPVSCLTRYEPVRVHQ